MFVHSIADLFTPRECADIIQLSREELQGLGGLVGGKQQPAIRRARISWLDDEGSASWVMKRILGAIAEANRQCLDFEITDFREKLQVAHYDASDAGHYDWHRDIGDGPIAQLRKATIVAQLSPADDYQGGALEINHGNRVQATSKDQGSATVFASFLPHRVVPVSAGARLSLTCWSHGPRFR